MTNPVLFPSSSSRNERAGFPVDRLLLTACSLILLGSVAGCRLEEPPPGSRPKAPETQPTAQPEPKAPTVEALPVPGVAVLEDFAKPGPPDPSRWAPTRLNDFEQSFLEVQPDPLHPEEGRLRLAASTVGTDDRTVKYLGVALRQPLDLDQPLVLKIELDWNRQANGSYLTQEIVLSPTWTTGDPNDTPDWLAFRLVGVPPGNTARPEIMRSNYGNLQVVERFGWPQEKKGMDLGRATVTLELTKRAVRLLLDDKVLAEVPDAEFRFDQAFLYLQMSTHSNYTIRELFFDRVEVRGTLLPVTEASAAPPVTPPATEGEGAAAAQPGAEGQAAPPAAAQPVPAGGEGAAREGAAGN